jgi:tRNA1(Val) A37 N6-methylase TrmN6
MTKFKVQIPNTNGYAYYIMEANSIDAIFRYMKTLNTKILRITQIEHKKAFKKVA